MPKTTYPDSTDLTARLTGLGLTTIPAGVSLDDELEAAIEVLETVSNQAPFLAESVDSTSYLSPKRMPYVDLGARFISITSIAIDGETLTNEQDYWLVPAGGPYVGINFAYPVSGEPNSIAVTGKRGNSENLPYRVWNAVLDYAAGSVHNIAVMAGTVKPGPVSEITQDTVKYKFGGGASGMEPGTTGDRLKAEAVRVFASLKRPSIGSSY